MNFAGRFHGRRFLCLLVRQNFTSECEAVLNKQINLELKSAHEYLAMAYHFDSSDVALPGVYGFFKNACDEERRHAETIMQYMNKRGGKIKLESVPEPTCSFDSTLQAMVQALEMEKTINEALLAAHAVAAENKDPNLCDFIENNFLQEQVDAMKQLSDYIRQIQRCDKELGSFIFDINLNKDKLH